MMDNYPDDWLITWPDIDGPIPVVCSSCHEVRDERDMRRPLTIAERNRGRTGWVTTLVCKTCRNLRERAMAPAALAKHLASTGEIPSVVIDLRVAEARERSTMRRSLSARKRWAEQYEKGTRAMLKEMDREKAQFRARAHYLSRIDDPARSGAAPALSAYAGFLSYVMTAVRIIAKEGKAPRTPWWENLYITRHCCLLLPQIIDQLEAAGRAYPLALHAGFPSWWAERERLLTFKEPPKEKVEEEPIDPTDFEALEARARSQWTKRNMGDKIPRKPRTRPFAPPIEIPGVDPAFTADDPPPVRRPREKAMSGKERLAVLQAEVAATKQPPVPPGVVFERTPRPVTEPITPEQYAEIEAQIRADNEALFTKWGMNKEDTSPRRGLAPSDDTDTDD